MVPESFWHHGFKPFQILFQKDVFRPKFFIFDSRLCVLLAEGYQNGVEVIALVFLFEDSDFGFEVAY